MQLKHILQSPMAGAAISPHFEVKSELKQGDSSSPILFNLVLEPVVKDVGEDRVMELNDNEAMLAYVDDVVILGNSRQEVILTIEKCVAFSRKMGFVINKAKIKYTLMTRHTSIRNDMIVGSSYL